MNIYKHFIPLKKGSGELFVIISDLAAYLGNEEAGKSFDSESIKKLLK